MRKNSAAAPWVISGRFATFVPWSLDISKCLRPHVTAYTVMVDWGRRCRGVGFPTSVSARILHVLQVLVRSVAIAGWRRKPVMARNRLRKNRSWYVGIGESGFVEEKTWIFAASSGRPQ